MSETFGAGERWRASAREATMGERERVRLRACALVLSLLGGGLTGCFETRSGAEIGGETHFMQECRGGCTEGLACVCGVCTRSCGDDAHCAELGESAHCMVVDGPACAVRAGGASAAASVPARACAAGCASDDDCGVLGAGFVCQEGVCGEAMSVGGGASVVFTSEAPAGRPGAAAGEGCTGGGCAGAPQPLVLLVLDTSGSTERKAGCVCASAACAECLPDCAASERSRWIEMVEVLGGTLDGYGCETMERTEQNGATYDLGYFMPHHVARGVAGDDGVLDVYADRVRFGLATFDGLDTYVGGTALVEIEAFDMDRSGAEDGLWSYNPMRTLRQPIYNETGGLVGSINYPGCAVTSYYMDTGVRGPHAEQGALVIAGAADARAVNARIQADLLAIRPYGGTPIAASLDDLYYYLAHDPATAGERAIATAIHVVLIADGVPDDDYRHDGCNCARESDAPERCGGSPDGDGNYDPKYDPASKHCPFPTAAEAARALTCGRGEGCAGAVENLHVIAYAIDDQPFVRASLDAIAMNGGTGAARVAPGSAELRAQLSAILEEIAVR